MCDVIDRIFFILVQIIWISCRRQACYFYQSSTHYQNHSLSDCNDIGSYEPPLEREVVAGYWEMFLACSLCVSLPFLGTVALHLDCEMCIWDGCSPKKAGRQASSRLKDSVQIDICPYLLIGCFSGYDNRVQRKINREDAGKQAKAKLARTHKAEIGVIRNASNTPINIINHKAKNNRL